MGAENAFEGASDTEETASIFTTKTTDNVAHSNRLTELTQDNWDDWNMELKQIMKSKGLAGMQLLALEPAEWKKKYGFGSDDLYVRLYGYAFSLILKSLNRSDKRLIRGTDDPREAYEILKAGHVDRRDQVAASKQKELII